MKITRNGIETAAGPSDWFTGAVYIDAIATPAGASRLSHISMVDLEAAGNAATWGAHVDEAEYAASPVTELRS